MTLEELRHTYHDGVIKKKARSEIRNDFMKEFGYATPQQFTMMMGPGSSEIPTPKELDWLITTVQRYHAHYTENLIQFNEPA